MQIISDHLTAVAALKLHFEPAAGGFEPARNRFLHSALLTAEAAAGGAGTEKSHITGIPADKIFDLLNRNNALHAPEIFFNMSGELQLKITDSSKFIFGIADHCLIKTVGVHRQLQIGQCIKTGGKEHFHHII